MKKTYKSMIFPTQLMETVIYHDIINMLNASDVLNGDTLKGAFIVSTSKIT